ncbi:nucleotide exchange factor GrpE [Amycolatopsis taiwanensis]|uniref:Protein GrpE n=1 Tax=Amycolatopsis taiwanensis TaxID=342230 RepID=A0A9W6R0Z0_9PSEU|nr:nucleotide exchange factor GrpE [Amycolatopsis taiwanensis]GLY67308.1 protein GrpE [Amycolatopsis taiwanensis]
MTGKHRQEPAEEPEVTEPVIVRDRRKIDPNTGEVRPPATDELDETGAAAETTEAAPPLDESLVDEAVTVTSQAEKELAERTADLQRLQAEYANYRKRVDRDREAVVATAKSSVVGELLPLLDDLERAEQHGDLTGPFKAVADKLVTILQRVGLEPFGAEGDPFDPSVHEAVQHSTSPEVSEPTVTTVLRRGYRFGDRVLRAALVFVTDHEPAAAPADQAAAEPAEAPVEGELPLNGNENAG